MYLEESKECLIGGQNQVIENNSLIPLHYQIPLFHRKSLFKLFNINYADDEWTHEDLNNVYSNKNKKKKENQENKISILQQFDSLSSYMPESNQYAI